MTFTVIVVVTASGVLTLDGAIPEPPPVTRPWIVAPLDGTESSADGTPAGLVSIDGDHWPQPAALKAPMQMTAAKGRKRPQIRICPPRSCSDERGHRRNRYTGNVYEPEVQ
ncbi:MAG: hypothetical protein Q7R41_01635 [Phycisphaerales bacterium]|nr:hypothetical protein [Phycisphaerales bacterium]